MCVAADNCDTFISGIGMYEPPKTAKGVYLHIGESGHVRSMPLHGSTFNHIAAKCDYH